MSLVEIPSYGLPPKVITSQMVTPKKKKKAGRDKRKGEGDGVNIKRAKERRDLQSAAERAKMFTGKRTHREKAKM